ncbi:MAG: PKD domain-containing protein [Bacteroidota bacterium]
MESCYHEQQIPVSIDFDYAIIAESFTVPVELRLTNKTTGADFYKWTFEGASLPASKEKQPGTISYHQAGTYTIKLEAWNDTQRNTKEIVLRLDSAVTLAFDVAVLVNDFVPAVVNITNHTRGATTYEWTFEGGSPSFSSVSDPTDVLFTSPGDHKISLKITNGRETFSTSKTITLQPALTTDFAILPSIDDDDYEAPLRATLQNHTQNGLRYEWSSNGGTITNAKSKETAIQFDTPGEYIITLKAENDKDTQKVTRTIRVKPNSHIYIREDVKLGISAAHSTIGCFYAPQLRKVLSKEDVSTDTGKMVDLIFFGINSSYSYCRFISPDSAVSFTFSAIPSATHTSFVNTLDKTSLSFTVADFDAMTTDIPIKSLAIKENDTGTAYFNNTNTPMIVLFETQDGRKGAIKVKSFVANGSQSYILADIKIQKSH